MPPLGAGEKVSSEKFASIVEDLYIKATSRASADALTGGAVDINSEAALQRVLEGSSGKQTIFAHPAFSNINLLSRFLESRAQNFKHEKLVNPLIWIKCVEAILCLIDQRLTKYSDYPADEDARDLDIDKLLMLKAQGEKIVSFIEKLAQGNYLRTLTTEYQKCLDHLSLIIKQEQTQYEEKSTKELCAEHRDFIDSEKSKTQRIASSHECKKCVEHVTYFTQPTNRYKILYSRSDLFWLYYREQKDPPHSRRAPPLLPECNEVHMLSTGEKKPTDVLNPTEKFKQICQEHAHFMEAQKDLLLRSMSLDLTHNAFNAIGNGSSQWLYPENNATTIPTLMLPRQNFPLNPIYIIAENKGKGAITHEYTIAGNVFHLQSYFTIKHNNQKIKILDLFKPYTSEQEYPLIENILHYWYGGRYAKADDLFKIQRNNFTSWHHFPFPPTTPYPAERDTFVSTAQRGPDQANQFLPLIQQLIEEDQREKRLQFNQEIMTHFSSQSPISEVYKAAQKVDVYFKLLDNLLTIMYNDLIGEEAHALHNDFAVIKYQDEESDQSIRNFADMAKYVQNYSSRHNPEHKQGNYLPFYIARTTAKLMEAFTNIMGSSCKPQFKAVTRVIDNINLLIGKYRMRNISPRAIEPTSNSNESELLALIVKQNEEKNKQIAQLMQSNIELAQETREVKEELAIVKAQLKAMMELLLEMKNGKN